jgi:hypothetical protein
MKTRKPVNVTMTTKEHRAWKYLAKRWKTTVSALIGTTGLEFRKREEAARRKTPSA